MNKLGTWIHLFEGVLPYVLILWVAIHEYRLTKEERR